MRNNVSLVPAIFVAVLVLAVPVGAQVIKDAIPGVTNPARIESTIACAGAITAQSVPEIKKLGFKSIINLREASEPGANVEAEAAAANAAGVKYAHVPFNAAAANPAVADSFLKAITAPGMEPAFVHCAGGNRAATMWFIKRVEVDGWDVARATEEATALGMTSAQMKTYALAHIQAHKK
jgi:uncharacterized protein (TIGR01244 family)